jgi:hypothetical protein
MPPVGLTPVIGGIKENKTLSEGKTSKAHLGKTTELEERKHIAFRQQGWQESRNTSSCLGSPLQPKDNIFRRGAGETSTGGTTDGCQGPIWSSEK